MTRVLALGLFVAMVSVACGFTSPGAGEQSVLIYKPWIFGHGGVDPDPVNTGFTYRVWSTDSEIVNMKPQRLDQEFDDTMTATGVPVDFHVVITYQVTDSVKLVKSFGNDYIDKAGPGFFIRNLDQPFRTAVRDAVKKHEMQDLAINVTAVEAVTAELKTRLNQLVIENGVPIKLLDVSVGRINPPDAVKHQRIATAEQEQRVITEQQRKLAEDQRKMAEESRAAADNAYNVKMQLSPEQYLRLETIHMQDRACAGGKCTFIIGSGATPVLPIPVR